MSDSVHIFYLGVLGWLIYLDDNGSEDPDEFSGHVVERC